MQDELIPFLHKKTIEGDAVALIEKYALDHNWGVKPPIPIEDIIEKHLKLPIDFNDLSKENAVGVIYSNGNIIIDDRLDPEEYPLQEGRYRFTLAHEAGHWILHQKLLNWGTMQPSLFDMPSTPTFICREIDTYQKPNKAPPEEWQANTFAAYLLMPYRLVLAAKNDLGPNRYPDSLCAALAERFAVSRTAMRIRLEALGLLHEPAYPQQSLAFPTT